jgi:hypothetical protein
VIDEPDSLEFLTRFLAVDDPGMVSKIDELIAGFFRMTAPDLRLRNTRSLLEALPALKIARLLRLSPFERSTWLLVDAQPPEIGEQYWRDVVPGWLHPDSPDLAR